MGALHRYLIVVAGGKGVRMGASIPKQFLLLAGKPLIFQTINRFLAYDHGMELIVVLPRDNISLWKELCIKHGFDHEHKVVTGGDERYDSVKNGLSLVRQKSLVAVHDAVRPLISRETIERCFDMAEKKGNAVPFIRPSESVREIVSDKSNRALRRDNIALIQTPQVFRSETLLSAYGNPYQPDFTDDASVIEAAGHKINLVEGNFENIKITTAEDLITAEALWNNMYT